MRRPLRRNTVEQYTQRLRLQTSSKPERQHLFGFAPVKRGALARSDVNAQLAQSAVFVCAELILGERYLGLRE